LATILTLAVSNISAHEINFLQYISQHGKSYNTQEEYAMRFARWLEVDNFIKEVNEPASEHTHTAGHN